MLPARFRHAQTVHAAMTGDLGRRGALLRAHTLPQLGDDIDAWFDTSKLQGVTVPSKVKWVDSVGGCFGVEFQPSAGVQRYLLEFMTEVQDAALGPTAKVNAAKAIAVS
jgi:hypothetical protein